MTKKIIAISGGFDPLHIGHIELINRSKKIGGKLVVILNNDNWLIAKKGFAFMPEKERQRILLAIKSVDEVLITKHKPCPKDMSVCAELKKLKPHFFANGGDRKADNIPEYQLCDKLGIKMVFNLGNKIQSSSELVNKALGIKSKSLN